MGCPSGKRSAAIVAAEFRGPAHPIRHGTIQAYNFHTQRATSPIFTRFVGRKAIDGHNNASVVYRDAWDVVVSMLQIPVVFRDLKM